MVAIPNWVDPLRWEDEDGLVLACHLICQEDHIRALPHIAQRLIKLEDRTAVVPVFEVFGEEGYGVAGLIQTLGT